MDETKQRLHVFFRMVRIVMHYMRPCVTHRHNTNKQTRLFSTMSDKRYILGEEANFVFLLRDSETSSY